jgi:hypothetical protein
MNQRGDGCQEEPWQALVNRVTNCLFTLITCCPGADIEY